MKRLRDKAHVKSHLGIAIGNDPQRFVRDRKEKINAAATARLQIFGSGTVETDGVRFLFHKLKSETSVTPSPLKSPCIQPVSSANRLLENKSKSRSSRSPSRLASPKSDFIAATHAARSRSSNNSSRFKSSSARKSLDSMDADKRSMSSEIQNPLRYKA